MEVEQLLDRTNLAIVESANDVSRTDTQAICRRAGADLKHGDPCNTAVKSDVLGQCRRQASYLGTAERIQARSQVSLRAGSSGGGTSETAT